MTFKNVGGKLLLILPKVRIHINQFINECARKNLAKNLQLLT
jgi:hypothetical protein